MSGGLHPQGRERCGRAGKAGLLPAATGLEGSDAHTAWPGPADAIACQRCPLEIRQDRASVIVTRQGRDRQSLARWRVAQ